ncbi:MAG: ATP-binding protein, partial [Chloroflexota bacterium]
MQESTIMAVEAPQNKINGSENGRSPFYGREDVFAWVSQHLAQTSPTQPLVLVGPARIGKTAVLQQIIAGKLGRSIVPIFIDFTDLLQENLSIFLGDLTKLAVNALAEAGFYIDPPDNTEFIASPYKAFKNQFLIPALEKLGERKLLLVCDNLNLLFKAEENGRFPSQSFDSFYRLIHAHARAYTLFTLTNPDPALSVEPLALIDNIPHYEIKNLDQETAISLIQQSQDFVVFRDAAQFIYQLTAGHPAHTQVYCQAVQMRKQSLNLRHITVADVTIVRQELAAANTLPPVTANSTPNFHIRQELPRQRANYRLPGSARNNSGLVLALAGLGVLALIVVLAALLFRDPIEQRLAGGQPPTISETAVILTSEALAAALIAATASATETAVPTQTAIVTPSVS